MSFTINTGEYWALSYSGNYWITRVNIKEDHIDHEEGLVLLKDGGLKYESKRSGWGNISDMAMNSRLATLEEIQWLLACIAAGKLVDKPKEIYYEIY